MLHDLIAMNVDDLRNGEMAVAVTNIIDINHLQGMYGKIFADSMATAMGNVIKELDIAMTAGETAILGEPKKVHTFNKLHQETENEIKTVLGDTYVSEALKQQLLEILQKAEEKRNAIMKEIEFNI
ncbi:MAG: hypothetical protein LBP53_04780 [Candidatus Peribacteria bacterium]|jgi:hypothetical protein|nr:hypothetical protein [Candidatus Peribacteria bacterium]